MIVAVLGGARSGKSQVAERVASGLPPPVTYVATGLAADSEMSRRIEAHKARRDPSWATVEVPPGGDLVGAASSVEGTLVIDSLGTWLAGRPGFACDGSALCRALRSRPGDTVVVSEEVGLGVHPSTEAGCLFRDGLGALNQELVAAAEESLLAVAGKVVRLEAAPS